MKRLMLPNLSVHENSFFGNAGCLSSSAWWLPPRLKALNKDFFFRGGGTGMWDGSPSKRAVVGAAAALAADAGARLPATLSTARRRWLFRRGWRWYMSSQDRQNTCRLHLSQRTAGVLQPHRSQWEPSRPVGAGTPPLGAPTSFLTNIFKTG